MSKITMSIRTEPELRAKLEYIIQGQGMSLADVIKTALFDLCRNYEQSRGEIPRDWIESRTKEILTQRGGKSRGSAHQDTKQPKETNR